MRLLDKLERKLGRFAIPNLTVLLVMGQTLGFLMSLVDKTLYARWALIAQSVIDGEVYRLVTFVFLPPATIPIFIFFALYLFYMMGGALEAHWGHFRFNLYILVGYLATVAVSFLNPEMPATNAGIGASVFLAFAWLYPDFQLLLFFILPVKIKYLAMLTWAGLFLTMLTGSWMGRFIALASVLNFFLFFGTDVVLRLRHGKRKMESAAKRIREQNKPFHKCTICGITEKQDPNMQFRYCSKCTGSHEYCEDHLHNHEHIEAPVE